MNKQKQSATASATVVDCADAPPPDALVSTPLPVLIRKNTDTTVTTNCSPAERTTVSTPGIESDVVETQDCEERVWRDGQLHWGERVGDGWTEHWHTQEGNVKRFGSKRGRDLTNHREWQERWEQTEEGTRIEKRVTQLAEPESGETAEPVEVERWIERLELTPSRILESRVGEDRVTSRQWRSYQEFSIDEHKKKVLQKSVLEEVWDWDPSKSKSQCRSRVTTTQRQPGNRVMKTEAIERDANGSVIVEEVSFEDTQSGRSWGSRETKEGSQRVVEEWTRNKHTQDFEEKLSRTDTGRTSGQIKIFSSASGELFTEVWGKERIDESTQREWSSKKRVDHRQQPWGEYQESVESSTNGVTDFVVHHEKWWTENGTHLSEQWTEEKQVQEESGVVLKLKKYGNNQYGSSACENWHEVYETQDMYSSTLKLIDKRLEKNNNDFHSVVHECGDMEHHHEEDRRIGQVDSWHIDKSTGDKWGSKEGEKDGVSWREKWRETHDEKWVEKWWSQGDAEWGELQGQRGSHVKWSERWGREGKSHWRERHEVDEIGNTTTFKDGEKWEGDTLKDKYSDHYGETIDGEKWAFKKGLNEDGEWLEKWNEKKGQKTAEKSGSNVKGDTWFEIWDESHNGKTATKRGTNANGEAWMETWNECGGEKYARKEASTHDEQWLEEWKEESDGSKWCKKWAATKDGESWGQAWGDSPVSDKHWGQQWRNDHVYNSWDY